MIAARVGMTLPRYLITCILVSILCGVLFAFLGFFSSGIIFIMSAGKGISSPIAYTFPGNILGIPVSFFGQVIGAVVAFIVGFYIAYLIMLYLPSLQKTNRTTRINLSLHNAVAYMYAMRRGGAQLLPIFRSLAENSIIYGEIALEFRQVVRDADFFGYDVITSLHNLLDTTPSDKLKEFIQDTLSVIESGGDLATFFSERVHLYQEEARFEQKQFLNFLGMVAESYVTLFVAGPLFLIIIMVVMGMMGSSAVMQLSAIAYAVLPIGSLIFIVLISMISIDVDKITQYKHKTPLREFPDIRIIKVRGEEGLFRQLWNYDRVRNIRDFLKDPFKGFVKNYFRTFIFTIPIAIVYFLVILYLFPLHGDMESMIDFIDDHIFICTLIVLFPFAIFYHFWRREILAMEELIPDFLSRMAGINQVGLTIAQAIGIMVQTKLGVLSYEVKRIKRDIEWGGTIQDALIRFEDRVQTALIARTVTLITKATEMSSSISEVLTIAASDAKMSQVLKKERFAEMFVYTAIVYLSFLVFIFVVGVITTQFLPVLSKVDPSGIPKTGAFAMLGNFPIQTYTRLMYHTCVIQAIFSGMIAGQMGENSLESGIKHACIMLVMAMIAFNFVF